MPATGSTKHFNHLSFVNEDEDTHSSDSEELQVLLDDDQDTGVGSTNMGQSMAHFSPQEYAGTTSKTKTIKVGNKLGHGRTWEDMDDMKLDDSLLRVDGAAWSVSETTASVHFDMWSSPADLGTEWGAGYALYFFYLRSVLVVMAIYTIACVPIMIKYGDINYEQTEECGADMEADGFERLHTWRVLRNANDEALCECTGINGGFFGLVWPTGDGPAEDYGKFCAVWDGGDSCNVWANSSLDCGSHCCDPWCYVRDVCPGRIPSAPPNNASLPDGSPLQMYYRYSIPGVCSNVPLLPGQTGKCDHGGAVGHGCTETCFERMTQGWLLTAGNLGYACYASLDIVWVYVALFAMTIVALVYSKMNHLVHVVRINTASTTPNDYAIMVKNLPKNASEEDIANFFEQEVRDRWYQFHRDEEGWDSDTSSSESPPGSSKPVVVVIGFVLETASRGPWRGLTSIQSSGAAVVVFEEKWAARYARKGHPDVTVQGIIDTFSWESTFSVARWYQLLRRQPCFWPDSQRALLVTHAPNPSDIVWENLGKSTVSFVQMNITSNALVVLLLLFCMWFCKTLKSTIEKGSLSCEEGADVPLAPTMRVLLPAAGVGLMNLLVKWLSTWVATMEVFSTRTQNMASTMVKLTMCLAVNTCTTPIWLHAQDAIEQSIEIFEQTHTNDSHGDLAMHAAKGTGASRLTDDLRGIADAFGGRSFSLSPCPKAFYQAEGLVDEMVWVALAAVLLPPMFMLLDPMVIAEKAYSRFVQKKERLKLFEPNLAFMYAEVNKITILGICFAPLFPLVLPFAMVGLIAMYGASKYCFCTNATEWVRKKQPQVLAGDAIFSYALMLSFHAILIMLPISCLYFLFPSLTLETSDYLLGPGGRWPVLLGLMIFFYLGLWLVYHLYARMSKHSGTLNDEDDEFEEETYYEAQLQWRKTARHYHITHFLYGSLYGKDMFLTRDGDNLNPSQQLAGMGATAVYGAPSKGDLDDSRGTQSN